ncbi:hypothetical protein KFL_014900020, partial [Klebsormidium nitens]
GRVCV